MTNTAARQGSDKERSKEYGETRVTTGVNHRRREAQSHKERAPLHAWVQMQVW